MNDLVKNAAKFANDAHVEVGQLRKYTNEPYIVHPIEVQLFLKQFVINCTSEMEAAGLLHDTVEDTNVTIEQIYEKFGSIVGGYVSDLTDISKLSDGNRKARKLIDLNHLAVACPESKTIKLCDILSNMKSIVEFDSGFAKVWMMEKFELMPVLVEADQVVYGMVNDLLNAYYANERYGFLKLYKTLVLN